MPTPTISSSTSSSPTGYYRDGHLCTYATRRTNPVEFAYISSLPDQKYTLVKPICIQLECIGDGEWEARFDEANIAMVGSTHKEAANSLAYDIIHTYEDLSNEEDVLIPDLKRVLRILREHIELCGTDVD
ncbi:MAG: hypothetical protein OXI53_09185 [Nitrospira sp.]|nr:hypothetical protein [Nitrospira sp.]